MGVEARYGFDLVDVKLGDNCVRAGDGVRVVELSCATKSTPADVRLESLADGAARRNFRTMRRSAVFWFVAPFLGQVKIAFLLCPKRR